MAFQISINSYTSDISRIYNECIKLNKPYEVGLKSFITYNSIPNVSKENKNNEFLYNLDNNKRYMLIIPTGTYELQDVIDFIENNAEGIKPHTFTLNKNTLKIKINTSSSVTIDFTTPNSIGKTLGFSNRKINPDTTTYSDIPIDIFKVNNIKIKCNLVKSNIEDLKRNDNTLYEFPLNSFIGEKIIERPNTITYFEVNTLEIFELNIRIVDDNNELVNFRKEKICLTLVFRPL